MDIKKINNREPGETGVSQQVTLGRARVGLIIDLDFACRGTFSSRTRLSPDAVVAGRPNGAFSAVCLWATNALYFDATRNQLLKPLKSMSKLT